MVQCLLETPDKRQSEGDLGATYIGAATSSRALAAVGVQGELGVWKGEVLAAGVPSDACQPMRYAAESLFRYKDPWSPDTTLLPKTRVVM